MSAAAQGGARDASAASLRRDREELYQRRVGSFRQEAEQLARRSALISNLRGLSFGIATIAFISAAVADDSRLGVGLGVVFTIAFLGLIVVHARVLGAEDLAWRFWRVNENAGLRVRDEWQALPEDGAQFQLPEHAYAGDLDIFGPRSLFQFMNVAHTAYGQAALARLLSRPDSRSAIQERQAAVRELADELELRQRLEAHTLRSPNPPGQRARAQAALDIEPLLRWAESKPELLPRRGLVWAAWVLPPCTLLGFLATKLFDLPFVMWALPLAAQMFISSSAAGAAARVFSAVSASPGAFVRLRPTLALLEAHVPKAPLLTRLHTELGSGGRAASAQMRRFERVLAWFELRHNGMVYPFINVLLCWDIHCVVALERWQVESGRALGPWLEVLGHWEALSSLAGLAHDNPDWTFPEIAAEPGVYEARGLGHPLIPARARVPNDVILEGPGSALLVTGSNMSGKSTLLRAMGLAAVLACAGSAVCARHLRISPLAVYTSMRISDSLSQGVSHFYAELKKLRAALEAVRGDYPVFFLLDEILHGTNSEERQVGARWILSELIAAGATGAVSTHDLALCALPPHLMAHVRTVHLRESVEGEQMTFDYKLRAGPVSGGNALRLMRSLGLEVPLADAAAQA